MERLGSGPRVKFGLRRLGAVPSGLRSQQEELTKALATLEAEGCCPVLDDGLAAGNGASLTAGGTLLVSPSGRVPGGCDPADVVELVRFDAGAWVATYRSRGDSVRPTSDAPLHWAALVEAPSLHGWTASPGAALHGHVLETTRAAAELALPLSSQATLFSTPPDRIALLDLLARAPYPEHPTVVRRDHGFFTLAADLGAAAARVVALARRARDLGLLPPAR